jgi:hypothetical protein
VEVEEFNEATEPDIEVTVESKIPTEPDIEVTVEFKVEVEEFNEATEPDIEVTVEFKVEVSFCKVVISAGLLK